jgi:uncharacterized membrane protein (DUF2068 family)
MRRDGGLRLIILYKIIRAIGAIVLALTLAVIALTGIAARVEDWVTQIHDHATSALWLELSAVGVTLLKGERVWIAVGALALDGGVLVLEAWALIRGWAWGTWLVIAASTALVPFEVIAIVRHDSVVRVAILVINLAIVGYLFSRIRHHR